MIKLLFFISLILSTLFAQPAWINNPHIDGFIAGIGISDDKNPILKRRIATVSARANLAENIKVEMSSYFKMITITQNNSSITQSQSLIEQRANEILVDSFVKETYEDKNGNFYVLVVLAKSKIQQ